MDGLLRLVIDYYLTSEYPLLLLHAKSGGPAQKRSATPLRLNPVRCEYEATKSLQADRLPRTGNHRARRRNRTEHPGNCPDAQSCFDAERDGFPFLVVDLLVMTLWLHIHTLLGLVSGVLHFAFERARHFSHEVVTVGTLM